MAGFIDDVGQGMYDGYLLENLIEDRDPEALLIKSLDRMEEEESFVTIADEDRGWLAAYDTLDTIQYSNDNIWKFAFHAYRFRGPWRNVVTNFSMLTGQPTIEFERDSDEKHWKEIAEANKWDQYAIDNIKHSYMLNDHLTHISRDEGAIPVIDPVMPNEITKIDYKPMSRTPTLYRHQDNKTTLEPENTVHHVLDRVGRESRGVSMMSLVLKELRYYLRWLEDYYNMGHMRARIPIVREVERKKNVASEALRLQKLPGVNRIVVENQGGKWNYPPAYRSITGVREGYEVFIQSIACAVNLPYFLVSSDYKNNSLASTLSANDPTVRLIRRNRVWFTGDIKETVRKAMKDDKVDVGVGWPPVLDKDKKAEAEAYEVGVRNGAMSSRSMAEDVFGKTWEGEGGERERIQTEIHQGQGLGTPDQGDKEYKNILKRLSNIFVKKEPGGNGT